MSEFDEQIVVAVFGAVAGSILTVAIGVVAFRLERRRAEARALRELILNMAERRAFVLQRGVVVPGAREDPDFAQLKSSVISVRNGIRAARSELMTDGTEYEALTRMAQACNHFLERVDEAPPYYVDRAADLRDTLVAEIRIIAGRRRRLKAHMPGELAF